MGDLMGEVGVSHSLQGEHHGDIRLGDVAQTLPQLRTSRGDGEDGGRAWAPWADESRTWLLGPPALRGLNMNGFTRLLAASGTSGAEDRLQPLLLLLLLRTLSMIASCNLTLGSGD